mmetsp:Transcript_52215/g.122175  ORF Transcript_52215/g.122175 Transcript_52215/m.122175 type:complete len:316 (-) Transcript_52215:87-1034(-)
MVTVGALDAQLEAESIGKMCKLVGGVGGALGGSAIGAISGLAAGPVGVVAGGIAGSVAGANMGLKGGEVAESAVLDSYNVHTNICKNCHSAFQTTKEVDDPLHDLCQRCRNSRRGSQGAPPKNALPPPQQSLQSAGRRASHPSDPTRSGNFSTGTSPMNGIDKYMVGVPGTDARSNQTKLLPGQACEVLSSQGTWKLAMVKEVGEKHIKCVYGDGSGEKDAIRAHVRSLMAPDAASAPKSIPPQASIQRVPTATLDDKVKLPKVGERCEVLSTSGAWKSAKVLSIVANDHVVCEYTETGQTKGIPWKYIPTTLRF